MKRTLVSSALISLSSSWPRNEAKDYVAWSMSWSAYI
jgi:hypothetical protein